MTRSTSHISLLSLLGLALLGGSQGCGGKDGGGGRNGQLDGGGGDSGEPNTDSGGADGTDGGDSGGADTGGSDGGDTGDTGVPLDCSELPAVPMDFTAIESMPQSEDFAFDLEGRMVNADPHGNLIATTLDGTKTILVPGIGYSAGIAFLPDGDVVMNAVDEGALKRISITAGSETLLTGGLAYPNGLGVDLDGFAYVAENAGNRVRRIDTTTGEYQIISDDVMYPNGVSFSPDYSSVYIGSFGGGVVYELKQDDEGSWRTRIKAHVPPTSVPDTCEGRAEEEDCFLSTGGLGTCEDDGTGVVTCQPGLRDTLACDGSEVNDPCTTDRLGTTHESVCTVRSSTGELFCPAQEADDLLACEGMIDYAACNTGGVAGTCYPTWEGVLTCVTNEDMTDAALTCEGLEAGDECLYALNYSPMQGVCADAGPRLICQPSYGGGGGLDGINTDGCGSIYVTEYTAGNIWRIPADGGEVDLAAHVPASWIPNMHFGYGVGGFERDVLYVMNYDRGGLFALETTVAGKPEPYMP